MEVETVRGGAVKYIFTREEKILMINLYEQNYSLKQLAHVFGCCQRVVRKELVRLKCPINNIPKQKCIVCNKLFKPKVRTQKYCHNPCNGAYSEKNKFKHLRYHYIKIIRSQFVELIKSNPKKAISFRNEMEKEEGKEFTDMVLSDIIEKPTFKNLIDIQQKYTSVWDKTIKNPKSIK